LPLLGKITEIQKHEDEKNLDKIFVIKYIPKFQESSSKLEIRVPDNVLHYLNFKKNLEKNDGKNDGKIDINIYI